MTKKVLTASPETTLEEAALVMRQHKIGCLPVLEAERLVGIITETDIFGVLLEVLGVEEASSRLEVLIDPRPDFFADVARTVNEQGIRLMSLLSVSGESGLALILRVDTADPVPLCQALEQAGFTVLSVQRPTLEARQGGQERDKRLGDE